ncbi:MAG: dephospho-CoA kinase [Cyanobacteria bacterium SIG31]|nr:dephospho-CoA kinase [Cyanobacteria bacterium SIG31]
MLKIAITGNIAAGKSTVENIIQEQGYMVYDTDKIAHEILAQSENIKSLFGTNDRKAIAQIVFSDIEKLRELEAIIHPQVKKELEKIFNQNFEVVFVSVPQLFESGFNTLFDKIIYVTAKKNIRKTRLIKRNNFSSEEAEKRINAQEELNKEKLSDYVINNNNGFEELKTIVIEILKNLIM